ncbi:hypothetical protein CP967_23630 [Streptomyces nitrosporeus]|uniref:Uncharacterized protein n=1 Tax=Streptomyces nitrosporeus TaxID=28894 RepID=A0A5J6FEP1_9ACTN|nr:DUF6243 family protein [Streptomyces nitrosporeus]QEU74583.1 hypothetical protein CP967_23630 [Streptomyces nitrosporeus]GGY84299.1 hypothetical protein GCM10010327_13210 [Streptomyces nitrosporeus]
MAKSRNNLLGVGGQRKKLSRADRQGAGPARDADRKNAADQKQELLRKMRERAQGAAADGTVTDGTADTAPAGTPDQGTAQS